MQRKKDSATYIRQGGGESTQPQAVGKIEGM